MVEANHQNDDWSDEEEEHNCAIEDGLTVSMNTCQDFEENN